MRLQNKTRRHSSLALLVILIPLELASITLDKYSLGTHYVSGISHWDPCLTTASDVKGIDERHFILCESEFTQHY